MWGIKPKPAETGQGANNAEASIAATSVVEVYGFS
jgi:hypothetical protein